MDAGCLFIGLRVGFALEDETGFPSVEKLVEGVGSPLEMGSGTVLSVFVLCAVLVDRGVLVMGVLLANAGSEIANAGDSM